MFKGCFIDDNKTPGCDPLNIKLRYVLLTTRTVKMMMMELHMKKTHDTNTVAMMGWPCNCKKHKVANMASVISINPSEYIVISVSKYEFAHTPFHSC